jgi:hypothetical protein
LDVRKPAVSDGFFKLFAALATQCDDRINSLESLPMIRGAIERRGCITAGKPRLISSEGKDQIQPAVTIDVFGTRTVGSSAGWT